MKSKFESVPAQGEPRAAPTVTAERICANAGVPYKTINEAAGVLRKGPRWLANWLKAHPVDRHGGPFYHLAGRTKLFTDLDIDRIRENLPCPSPFDRRDRRNRQVTRYAAPISDRLLSEAQELLTENSLKKQVEREIETGTFNGGGASFLEMAVAYMKAGGERKFLGPIINYAGEYAIRSKGVGAITQTDLAHLADALYPDAVAQTHNRQVYSPVIAVLHFGGVERKFKRPKGWRGKKAKSSLEMEQAFALLNEAEVIDTEFGLLCYTCLYTGRRIGELLNDDTRLRDLNLKRGTLYSRDTKNGEPVTVHLPPILIEKFKAMPPRPYRHGKIKGRSQDSAGIPFLERDPDQRLFRFHQGGYLRNLLAEAMRNAGLSFPRRERGFHLFCHTYATWMLPLVGDNYGLARTGRWKDPRSAEGYLHTKVSAEARRADMLPTPASEIRGKSGGEKLNT